MKVNVVMNLKMRSGENPYYDEKIEDRNWSDIFVKIASNQFSIEEIASLLF